MTRTILFVLFFVGASRIYAAEMGETKNCQINVSKQQPWVIELYTSEGCSSCPPADRWLSEIAQRGDLDDRLMIPLSLHVDYWDYIGWQDPFAQSQFGKRHEKVVVAQQSRSIYTPQVILNGKTVRNWRALNFDENNENNSPPPLLNLTAEVSGDRLLAKGYLENSGELQIYLAIVENKLKNSVSAGENEGVTLKHDAVVRVWVPANLNKQKEKTLFEFNETISNTWIRENLDAYVLVQDNQFNTLAAARMDTCW